jgi:hypothetical protein
VALLTAKSFRFHHGNALQPDLVQRFFHLVQFERLDDSLDLLHARPIPGGARASLYDCPARS